MDGKQRFFDYKNKIDDYMTLGSDDLRVWEEWDKEYMPNSIKHYCVHCKEEMGFIGVSDRHVDVSTYILFTMINLTPVIMIKKIYACCWCGHRITATSILEEVGNTIEEGEKPIIFSKYRR